MRDNLHCLFDRVMTFVSAFISRIHVVEPISKHRGPEKQFLSVLRKSVISLAYNVFFNFNDKKKMGMILNEKEKKREQPFAVRNMRIFCYGSLVYFFFLANNTFFPEAEFVIN